MEEKETIHKDKKYLEKKKTEFKNLEKDWSNFLLEDTYLIYERKQEFLKKFSKLRKFPLYLYINPIIHQKIKNYKKKLLELRREIKKFNKKFIEQRLDNYKSFFDGKDDGLKCPLDQEQRIAVIKDDKHNLVVAGAGSGKTSVITNRIAYLVRRKDKIEKERILALAFTRVAAQEMKDRLLKNYKVDVDISTFHSLGYQIIQEETGKRPNLLFGGNEYEQYKLIEDIFNTLLKEKKYQDLLIDYLAYHVDEDIEEESFEDKEEYYKYLRNKRYTTLNNITVKSVSERDIANFLFKNTVNFEYEPLVEWVDEGKEEKEYHPDFYLPDYDIYIEHWGLNENMEVPPWFSKTSKEYNNLRKWKLGQFKKYEKNLIETWEYERRDDVLLYNLKLNLKKTDENIKFVPKKYEELIESTQDFKEKRDEIAGLIASFIKIAKSNYLYEDDIAKKIKSKKYNRKQKLFGRLALEVYRRYQEVLKKEDKIDFNDMINTAVQLVNNNPEKYINRYDHVLVDEFQDISYQRLQLINGFINEKSATKLFCVGDDWQSIYQFTGSDVTFFTNFTKHFRKPEIILLKSNYRCSQTIVEMSNNLISLNKHQIKKDIVSKNKPGIVPILFEFSERLAEREKSQKLYVFSLIDKLISEGIKPEEIMVLSRFNKNLKEAEIHCGANGIPIQEEIDGVVKRKGVRFFSAHKAKGTEAKHVILMELTSGIYGFPCEIQDSSVFELAQRFEKKSFIDEERRLFYVALTRSMEFLYLFTIENNNSMFLSEIESCITKISIKSPDGWNKILSEFIPTFIKGLDSKREYPLFCQICGKPLVEREGKYGKFLGCTGFPQCRYTFNFVDEDTIPCPDCGKPLIEQDGKNGKYLRCIRFPQCSYQSYIKSEDDISCPRCNSKLAVRSGRYGMFLGCTNYPQCKFTFNLESRSKSDIFCPKCRKQLRVIEGKNGKFIGCSGYPSCNFTYNI
ncbi:MAG: UvrD-helicase domain-containing protein [Promethearchaeota archaeon]